MREKQRVVALFCGEHLDRVVRVLPWQAKAARVPLTKLKPVGTSLADQQLQQLKPGHNVRSIQTAFGNLTEVQASNCIVYVDGTSNP